MPSDELSFSDRQRAMPIAQHEVGHFVAGRVLRFRTVGITVEMLPNGGHRGGAEVLLAEPLKTTDEINDYLRRRVQELYAGALAQTLRENAPKMEVNQQAAYDDLMKGGAADDYTKVRELIRGLRNIEHSETDAADENLSQEQLTNIERGLWSAAVEIVETHGETITKLGSLITSRMKARDQKAAITKDELDAIPYVRALSD